MTAAEVLRFSVPGSRFGVPVLVVLLSALAATTIAFSNRASADAPLTLTSSDTTLVERFDWARRQAIAYAFDGDPVGLWYEAALPGREAFCMRDVAHQANGAHALGLWRHTQNMLRRFAENISESKDWASFWEIDRYNRPAPVDYKNDAEFWYNLPANFDVLDACYRMYLWTGDQAYVDDPVFVNFYDRTVTDYVERWGLDPDRVMARPRHMNVRGPLDPDRRFQFFRGIPTYHESRDEYAVGLDLLAAQYSAYRAYARIQELRGSHESGRRYSKKAEDVRALANGRWWSQSTGRFFGYLRTDGQFEGEGGTAMLYRDAAEDGPKLRGALDALLERIRKGSVSVEGQSHHAEILYRYGVPDVAYAELLDLTRQDRDRREYPEVSFSVVGAIVTGLMGTTVEGASPLLAETEGHHVDRVVRTLPSLTKETAWAELGQLPIPGSRISVRHDGVRRTTFTNLRGPSLIWQATLPGQHERLLVNGRPQPATAQRAPLGRQQSSVRVTVAPGTTVRVELP
jgi:hypothetical protein